MLTTLTHIGTPWVLILLTHTHTPRVLILLAHTHSSSAGVQTVEGHPGVARGHAALLALVCNTLLNFLCVGH